MFCERIEASAIYVLLKLYSRTCKIEVDNTRIKDYKKPVIFAFWHEIILFAPFAHDYDRPLKILHSTHKDSVLASMVTEKFGIYAVWGSSNREPVRALKSMVREIKKGFSVGITPDGPKGPRRKLKKGVLELAYLTKAPIVPLVGKFSSYFRVNSWDRMIVPKPFSKIKFVMKDPIFVNSKDEFDVKTSILERILNESG